MLSLTVSTDFTPINLSDIIPILGLTLTGDSRMYASTVIGTYPEAFVPTPEDGYELVRDQSVPSEQGWRIWCIICEEWEDVAPGFIIGDSYWRRGARYAMLSNGLEPMRPGYRLVEDPSYTAREGDFYCCPGGAWVRPVVGYAMSSAQWTCGSRFATPVHSFRKSGVIPMGEPQSNFTAVSIDELADLIPYYRLNWQSPPRVKRKKKVKKTRRFYTNSHFSKESMEVTTQELLERGINYSRVTVSVVEVQIEWEE